MVESIKKKKILIVDDDPMLVTLMVKTLENLGFDVLKAYNGQEGLAVVKENKPDLIILDQMMPKMDGIKACALLKADKRFHDIPIIMFTASAEDSDRKLSQQMGADAFCNKPLNEVVLVQKIRELLGT
ncbi:MAG: response regulator [Candidatus Omnitrophota bacterium]